jgi:hypothetical protein
MRIEMAPAQERGKFILIYDTPDFRKCWCDTLPVIMGVAQKLLENPTKTSD